jgi:hypothetical protein
MTKVAERYGVSGSYLARVCTHLNVPRPERGHWAKLAFGKASPHLPLPEARPGDQLYWTTDGEPTPARKPRAPRHRAEKAVRIPRTQVHALIRDAKLHFERGRPVDEGAYLKPYKKLLVDVAASQAALDKGLDLANDLFNALESIGCGVVIAPPDENLSRARLDEREAPKSIRDPYRHYGLWSPQRPTVVYVGSIAIGLAVLEMSEQVLLRYVGDKYIREADYIRGPSGHLAHDYTWTTTRELPSGRFRIIAYSPYFRVEWALDWQETRKGSLRSSIRSIVKAMEEAATELEAKLDEAERQAEVARQEWLAAEERRRREEDQRRIEQSVQDSKQHLAEVIEQWDRVMSVEQFLAGVEHRAAELPDDEKGHVLERLTLARDFLGSQDPLDFFRSWRTPKERYQSKYSDELSG